MQDASFADRAITSTSGSATPCTMVSNSDVNGTEVYSRSGDYLGEIDRLLIDKQSGQIAYAVMSFGDFLGLGA